MSQVRRLLIATWGSPAEWGTVRYVLEDGRQTYETCTTLKPVLKYLCGESCDAVLVVLDSLVDLPSPKGRPREESECFICCESCRNILRSSYASYIELRENVRRFVEEVVRCLGIEAKVRVVVAPAVGSPGGNRRFRGEAQDFESVVLYELGRLVLEESYGEIILDLTHGLNFMPSVTLRVAYRLASVLLVAHKELREGGVRLRVYNSDPYRRPPSGLEGAGGIPEVRLNLIIEDQIKSIQLVHRLPRPVRSLRKLNSEVESEVGSLRRKLLEDAGLIYLTLYYPLPLALCAAVSKVESPLKSLERVFELWLKQVEVKDRVVERALTINPDTVYVSLLAEAATRRLQGIEYPTPTDKLKEIAEIYNAIHSSYYYIISNEISQLEKALEEASYSNWIRYNEILRQKRREEKPEEEYPSTKITPNTRIMIAHAGLQKEFIEVGPSKLLRYTKDVERILEESGLKLERKD